MAWGVINVCLVISDKPDMNQHDLFRMKEELLKDLERRIQTETFHSDEEKQKYYDACVEGILELYNRAMQEMIKAA
jgi:hypothetical protein